MNAEEPGAVEFIGFWYRAGAMLWDGIIMGAVAGVLTATLVGDQAGTEHGSQMARLLISAVAIGYTLGFWILAGTTPGKWLCSCRIVDARTGGKPKVWQFLVRYLGYAVSTPLLLGYLWVLRDKRRRAFHDLLARTAVIGDGSLRSPTPEERVESNYCIRPAPWGHKANRQVT